MRKKVCVRAVLALVGAVLFTGGALADTTTPRLANVLVVNNEAWWTDLAVVAEDGEATVRISDCKGAGASLTVPMPYGGGMLVPNITDYQCSGTKLGVIKLPVLAGNPRLWAQASYRDSIGNRNVVMLPALPEALPQSYAQPTTSFTAAYVFEGIENRSTLGKSTFVALIPDGEGETTVELRASSYSGGDSTVETLTIDGFTFHELKTPVEFGRLVVKHTAPARQTQGETKLFALALVGDREAGSPRVELPRTQIATTVE